MTASIAPRSLDPNAFPYEADFRQKAAILIGYASLAPSGHNTQPWRFAIGADVIKLFADRRRALPVVDPYDRELTISCGAALGMLEVAARRFGFAPKVSLSPDASDPDLLAHIALPPADAPHGQPSKHFDAIMTRRTARAAFLPDTPPEALIQTCTALSAKHSVEFSVVSDLSDRQAIAKLVGEGDQIQFDDPSFRRELAAWVHSARLGSKDGMSGASFGMPDVLSAVGRFVIRTFDLGNGIAAADEDKITSATPMLGLFSSAADDQDAWLNTGRALSAVLLEVTAEGFTASYLNQPIETRSLRGKLAKAARITGQPQILIRLGKTHSRFAPTVRRDVADILI